MRLDGERPPHRALPSQKSSTYFICIFIPLFFHIFIFSISIFFSYSFHLSLILSHSLSGYSGIQAKSADAASAYAGQRGEDDSSGREFAARTTHDYCMRENRHLQPRRIQSCQSIRLLVIIRTRWSEFSIRCSKLYKFNNLD